MPDTITITKRRWTLEDDARLAELRAQGRTHAECGFVLERTRAAVQSRVKWLKEKDPEDDVPAPQPDMPDPETEQEQPDEEPICTRHYRPWTPEDDAQLAEYRQGDAPDDIIALAMGRTTSAVQARISVLKARGEGDAIPSHKRPSPVTPDMAARARAMRADGLTLHQISRRLGVYPAAVSRALKSAETTEDSPGEGVRVGRTVPDLGRAESDVEQAKAALARAEARHREAMEPLLVAMRAAIHRAGLVPGPEDDDSDDDWPEPARIVVDLLRSSGIELRVRA